MALSLFHPLVQTWFEGRFETSTDAQTDGWPAIAEGRQPLTSCRACLPTMEILDRIQQSIDD